MSWISVHEKLPDNFQRVEVLAWEFGQPVEHIAAEFWQSSEPNQPPKFYFDEITYQLDCPCSVSSKVYFWKPRDA